MKKQPLHDDQAHDDQNQRKVHWWKKPFNIPAHAQQRQHHQPLQIQAQILNAKTKAFIHIREIAKSTFGVWTVDHRILELLHINLLARPA